MSRRGEGFRRLEREILGEKAAALGRAGERLEQALETERRLTAALDAAGDTGERDRLGREVEGARRRAREARLALLIQREALGLRHHAVVDQQFPDR